MEKEDPLLHHKAIIGLKLHSSNFGTVSISHCSHFVQLLPFLKLSKRPTSSTSLETPETNSCNQLLQSSPHCLATWYKNTRPLYSCWSMWAWWKSPQSKQLWNSYTLSLKSTTQLKEREVFSKQTISLLLLLLFAHFIYSILFYLNYQYAAFSSNRI